MRWEVRPPLFAPRLYYDLECPQVFTIDGRSYLTAAIMEDRTQRYWSSEQFHGPYRTPPGGNLLAPLGHYAGRVCAWRGQHLYFCWHRGANDWAGIRNPYGKFVVAPLVLEPAADGRLVRRSFPGWEAYRAAPLAPLSAAGATTLCSPSDAAAVGGWTVDAPGGFEILAAAGEAGDACLSGTIVLDAAAGGLACRLDGDATGYFLRLTPGSAEVVLTKWLPGGRPEEVVGFPWFNYVDVQRGGLDRPLPRGAAIPFQLLAVGPYIELSLWGEVVIAAVTGERRQGRLGVWAEDGRVTLGEPLVAPMRQPAYR